MSRIFYILHFTSIASVFALGAMMAACTSNSDEGGVSADYIKVTDVVMSGNVSSTTLHIEADCAWSISENTSWLTIGQARGTGNADVELTTGFNPSSLE